MHACVPLPSLLPGSLNDNTVEWSHSDVSTSNDEEDKAQTSSITLRQGNTQELPWHYCHSSDKSKREGVAAIHHPTAAVFNSINKKAPASECLSVPVTVFDNHFWTKVLLYLWGKPERAVLPPDALAVLNPVRSGWNTGCIPRRLRSIWVMHSIISLLLATSLFRMNGFPQRCQGFFFFF